MKKKRSKVKFSKNKIILLAIALIVAGSVFFFIWLDKQPGEHDDFAICLSKKGLRMAGTDSCKACKIQKKYFGRSFKHINYINCEKKSAWCYANDIRKYPTWLLPDNSRIIGVKSLHKLSRLSDCSLE